MNDNLLFVAIALFVINILVNMFMIYHICDKIELVNKEVHSNNSYIVERVCSISDKKTFK